jgi:uncharacterized membrane-anchored protein YitT (DUF2179 family)/predicted metal-dependent HD superfamily phosphohydrolase
MPAESNITHPIVTKAQYDSVYSFTIKKLKEELPHHLTYHNVQHTIGVLKNIEHLVIKEQVQQQDTWLLLTAGVLHDTGFIRSYQDHEEHSCIIAREVLPQFGYDEESIKKIERLIMVTKLPQAPTTLLEQIICDADLYYLGTEEFFFTAETLYKEFKHEGIVSSYDEWQQKQMKFLEAHRYFTKTARAEREARKQQYIKQLQLKYKVEKKEGRFSGSTWNNINDAFFILVGVIVAGFALKSFLVPNHFFDGGLTGISLLLHEFYHYNLAYVIILVNLPLIILGYFTVSKSFAVKTFICVCLLGVCLIFFPYPEIITPDNVFISLFGGFFLGTGIGLCMRAGCALDGVEVLAIRAFKKTPFTVTEIILAINILIFSIAALELGLMKALYSVLTYFTASKFIDYVVEGFEAYTGVTIVSEQCGLLKHRLVNEMGKGITVYKGERGFLPGQFDTSTDCDIIFTVVTRLELRRLKNLVHETDPKAFVFATTIREASGGILRRRQGHG